MSELRIAVDLMQVKLPQGIQGDWRDVLLDIFVVRSSSTTAKGGW